MINDKIYSCEYFTIKQPVIASGVTKKINNIVDSLNSMGMHTKLLVYDTSLIDLFYFISDILFSKANLMIIRFPGVNRTILIFPFIIIKILQGHKIVLDIPTPLIVTLQEIKHTNNVFGMTYRWIPVLLFYPWILMPYSRIIQSGEEHPYFLLLIRHKTKLIGNGIDVNSIKYVYPKIEIIEKITIICVAQLEIWHGYDRILVGLYNYINSSKKVLNKIEIYIVGDGNEKVNLIELCKKLGLENYVNFTGNLTGPELDDVFKKADLAIASLGSYRVNLKSSSPLKTREYTARGLPFVSADNDPDFQSDLPFVFKVPNDSTALDFYNILSWYVDLFNSGYKFNQIREYAMLNLDFSVKVKNMFLF